LIATGCRWNRLDHSIIWSVRASSDGGIVRLRALADRVE